MTPLSSVAVAVTVVDPDTVAPSAGAVKPTVGGRSGPVLVTVTVLAVEVVVWLVVSVATAVRVCEPLLVVVVSQLML